MFIKKLFKKLPGSKLVTIPAKKIIDTLPNITNQEQETAVEWSMTPQDWAAVMGGTLGAFMAILDIQITNASLREMQASLGLDFSESGWISTSYLIAEIIVIPLTGFLTKVFGMRRYMALNCIFFVLASILCGFAWNLPSIICFRVLQGLSGGALIPLSFQTMLLFMPADKRSIGMALFGMTATLAPTLGPSLGGWLTEYYSWRANFFINVIPGAFTLGAVLFGMPATKLRLSHLKEMDIWGTLTMAVGLGTLTYMLDEGAKVEWFEDTRIQICFLVTLASLSLFFVTQLLGKNPLLNLKLLWNRNFGISAFITMITALALYGGIYSLSLYLGQIQNYRAIEIGQVMMWLGIPQMLVIPFTPYLMKKFDARFLALVGMTLFAISNYMNTELSMNFAGDQFRTSLIIRALGQPLFMISLSAIAIGLISPAQAGNASSIYNVMRNLGGSIGIALANTFAISRQSKHFYQLMENLNYYNPKTIESIQTIKTGLMIQGIAPDEAQKQAVGLMISSAYRGAMIQSFSDIFAAIFFILLFALLLVILLKKVDPSKSALEAGGH